MVEDFDMLAATLAHEIKNPLALVRANLDYIEQCDTEKRHSANYSVMKIQLERTNSMIKDFVGLMLGGVDADLSIDMRVLIESVAADYASTGIMFEIALEDGLIVRGNARLLAIVFSNAIKNSIEAGAGIISISAQVKQKRILFILTDNGEGLSAQTVEHLNDDMGYSTKKYGNGLGVLISRRIINGCGGSYSIGNAEPRGCEVIIELPANSLS